MCWKSQVAFPDLPEVPPQLSSPGHKAERLSAVCPPRGFSQVIMAFPECLKTLPLPKIFSFIQDVSVSILFVRFTNDTSHHRASGTVIRVTGDCDVVTKSGNPGCTVGLPRCRQIATAFVFQIRHYQLALCVRNMSSSSGITGTVAR